MKFNHVRFANEIQSRFHYKDTLQKVGAEIGISKATLSRVLKGSNCEIGTILKICEWLRLPITHFIDKSK